MRESHRDCRNFAPLDVVKGICHRTKDVVGADDERCENFDRLPRCRHCSSFMVDDRGQLGTCGAAARKPMAYPEMVAVTCESFAWRS
jgi:4-hydroxyphenylacetate decarboxylase small subunit